MASRGGSLYTTLSCKYDRSSDPDQRLFSKKKLSRTFSTFTSRQRVITTAQVVALSFFSISGGAIGSTRWYYFWGFNGFTRVSTFARSCKSKLNVSESVGIYYPHCGTYIFNAMISGAAYNDPAWETWTEINFSDIPAFRWRRSLQTVTTLTSNWGQYCSEMFCVSFQMTGMAESGLAPKIFAT